MNDAPTEFRQRATYKEALDGGYGTAYAAVIEAAGLLYQILAANTAQVEPADLLDIGKIGDRHKGLLQLSGMQGAAVAILKAEPHNQSHLPAAQLVGQHTRSMAKAIERDAEPPENGRATTRKR